MTSVAFNYRTPLTIALLSGVIALAACGKKEDTTTMPSTPANTAPSVTTPMPDTTMPSPMGGSSAPTGGSSSMGSSNSSGSMASPSTSGGSMTSPTPGAATGSIPNNDSSPAAVAPASGVR